MERPLWGAAPEAFFDYGYADLSSPKRTGNLSFEDDICCSMPLT